MPQPLNTISPAAARCPVKWGAEFLQEYPQFAALAMEQIATWSRTDWFILDMLAKFIRSDIEILAAMFRDVKQEARNVALLAAAKYIFYPDHYELFAVSLRTTKASRNRRDEFAHHVWGTCDAVPDALILADPKHLAIETSRLFGPLARGGGSGRAPVYANGMPWDSSQYYVYREKDFITSIDEAKRAAKIVQNLRVMSNLHPPFFNPQRFDSICSELRADPLIQQALQPKTTQK